MKAVGFKVIRIGALAIVITLFLQTLSFAQFESLSSASELYNQGNREYAEGNYAVAIACYSRAIDLDHNMQQAYLNRGLAKQAIGKLDDALADLASALRLKPHSAIAHNNKSAVLIEKGDFDAALVEIQEAIKYDSHLPESYLIRGIVYFIKGNSPSAAADLTRAISQLPPYAADDFRIRAKNPSLALAYSIRALVRRKAGDLDNAISDFDKSLEITPDAKVFNNRGTAKMSKGDLAGALTDLNAGLNIDPNLPALHYNRGKLRLLQGDYDGAIADFSVVIGEREKVVAQKEMYLEGDLSDPGNLAKIYEARGIAWENKDELDKAYEDYSSGLAVNPNAASCYANRGRVQLERGELDAASADLDRAIEMNPKPPMPYMDRGLVHMVQGRQADADKDFQKCLELNPALKPLLDYRTHQFETRLIASARKISDPSE